MELEKLKHSIELEYNKLLSELSKLEQKQEIIKPEYQKLEQKYYSIYNEAMHLSNDLVNHTNQEEKREEEFINSKTSKQSIILRLSIGAIAAIIFFIIFLTNLFITNSYTVTKIPLIIGFTISSFSLGYGTGGIIYQINKNKYKNKLKDQYKSSKEHSKHNIKHYDKLLTLERKCKELNIVLDKYNKIKKEYQELTNQINLKKQEIERFKIKAFNIIFSPKQDNIIRPEEKLNISNEYLYQRKIPIKQRKKYKRK